MAEPNATYNLLDLANGVLQALGLTDLPEGEYNQMRLVLSDEPEPGGVNILGQTHPFANYFIDKNDLAQELKVPSGLQSGIKIVGGFTITTGQTTDIILDFDALKSIVKAGASGKWLLKPVIKVLNPKKCAIINGIVADAGSGTGIGGATVTVQTNDSGDMLDQPNITTGVVGTTITEDDGSYSFWVKPGAYYVVAHPEGYEIGCAVVEAAKGETYEKNFDLNAITPGRIVGTVTVTDGDDEQTVNLSFRQVANCAAGLDQPNPQPQQIEVLSLQVANNGNYEAGLPEGTYTVVASTEGKDAQQFDDVAVTAGADTTLDITW